MRKERYIEMKDMASVRLFEPKKELGRLEVELERLEAQIAQVTDYGFDVGPVQVEELYRRKKAIKKELAELEQGPKLNALL